MFYIVTIIIGYIFGLITYKINLKINFKNNTIERKIQTFSSIITQWVNIRNVTYAMHPHFLGNQQPSIEEFTQRDKAYSQSLVYIGSIILVCEDKNLVEQINQFNEKLYRTEWFNMNAAEMNQLMNEMKDEGFEIVDKMRLNVQSSSQIKLKEIWQ